MDHALPVSEITAFQVVAVSAAAAILVVLFALFVIHVFRLIRERKEDESPPPLYSTGLECQFCNHDEPCCIETSPGGEWICIRPIGHKGMHVACSESTHVLASWPQEEDNWN